MYFSFPPPINSNSYANNDSDREFLMRWTFPLYSFRVVFFIKKCLTVGAISKMDILDRLNKVDFAISMHGQLSVALHLWISLSVRIEWMRAIQILHDKCLAFSLSRTTTFRTSCHRTSHMFFSSVFSCTWFYKGSNIFQQFSHRFH